MHHVTDAIHDEAAKIGLKVVAGELVGLVPLDAMLCAGRHYNNGTDANDISLVQHAIDGLMLDKLGDFDPSDNIIEWAIQGD